MEQEKINKAIEMAKLSAEYRGTYISEFVKIEHILADILIQIKHNGIYEDCYKGFKTARTIVKDFFEAVDTVSDSFQFTNKDEAKEILAELSETRNHLAHYLVMETDEKIEQFDNDTIYFYSFHLQQLREVSYNRDSIALKCSMCRNAHVILASFQAQLYKDLGKSHPAH